MIKSDIKVGFIGTGVMGAAMASHILDGGYKLSVYNRTKEKALALINKGAIWKASLAELAKDSDVVITIVGYPKDVEEVYLGQNGIINNIKKGSYVIDMTTSKPSLAKKIYEAAKEKDIFALDAPVSGGDVGAAEGTLSIMIGGDREAFENLKPIFELMGKNIVLQGGVGAGQHTKMCNQIAIASNIMGVCEALVYAKKSGLDPETVLKSIGAGGAASWQLSAYAPRILNGDFAPGFYIKHFVKDMKIALEEADAMGLDTPALSLSKKLYDKLIEQGKGDLGTQALYKLYLK
ncbi:NAD(P)-dependent oxidoreductase [Clostridium pasteurianum]|uniref:Beta-hydroxyacid dehydrogenase, 3-hydroxyisobutyrate dehydrogenase n=1 Tax=Clostridium pasteurianum BC1 TaxID=86416 RepID=R4K9L9_CLOPA|nr:NAD(P)-dependent oxidoreductase [Clostridium pasteurianum]AGK97224.1 beta-hydroxyacid dehydrogenase, 3-hydroxyisobutyrate dehydrogenase [Clostridium pasteurianum BC1]